MSGVRVVRSDEWDDEIVTLDRACFTAAEAFKVEILEDMGAVRWVALDGDIPVGFAVAYPQSGGKDSGAYLDRYGVLPEYAGRGIGVRLLRAWLRHAAKAGATAAWTYTVASNARSINALLAVRFRAWLPDWSDRTSCIWRREL